MKMLNAMANRHVPAPVINYYLPVLSDNRREIDHRIAVG
jgi:hypothetical protein